MLEEKVLGTIKKYEQIKSGDTIVLGVSGGPDSICLLNILKNLQNELKIDIVVAHINHMIREEADLETDYVRDFCIKKNVPCFVKKENIFVLSGVFSHRSGVLLMELCGLELADSVLQRTLDRDTLYAGSAEEADRLGVVVDVLGVLRRGDRTAVRKAEAVFVDLADLSDQVVDEVHGLVQRGLLAGAAGVVERLHTAQV